ncbi:MAG TPA: hypothetical protein VEZ48_11125 [Sphingomonadaceae bacterium]|nr:hypothetical protein [Sphingomonadaceae bacterium]
MSDSHPAHNQRIRIGLTGLAFVFLLVMLGAVFTRASDEQPITATGIEAAGQVAPAPANASDEPLAALGVAPGSAPAAPAATARTVPVEDPLRPERRR